MALETSRRSSQGDRPTGRNRLPPGQKLTEGWPVLSYGATPKIDLATWRFTVGGLVEQPREFTWDEFMALPQSTVRCDIHCVTRWSKFDTEWEGVLLNDLAAIVKPRPEAKAVLAVCYGGYSTNLRIDDATRDDVLLAHSQGGRPLDPDHGGPLRLVVPHLYFWKSAKWIRGLTFLDRERPGFWEQYGYHMRGDPWQEERYS